MVFKANSENAHAYADLKPAKLAGEGDWIAFQHEKVPGKGTYGYATQYRLIERTAIPNRHGSSAESIKYETRQRHHGSYVDAKGRGRPAPWRTKLLTAFVVDTGDGKYVFAADPPPDTATVQALQSAMETFKHKRSAVPPSALLYLTMEQVVAKLGEPRATDGYAYTCPPMRNEEEFQNFWRGTPSKDLIYDDLVIVIDGLNTVMKVRDARTHAVLAESRKH